MAEYGVTNEGFVLKRLVDIKAEIESNLKASFGDVDTSPQSVFGQLIGVFSEAISETWEQMENVYDSSYPDSAEGVSLDEAASLVGVNRLGKTSSTAVLQCNASEGTIIPAGNQFKQSIQGNIFESVEDITVTKTACQYVEISVDDVIDNFEYKITIDGHDITYTSAASGDTRQSIASNLYIAFISDSSATSIASASYVNGDEFLSLELNDLAASSSMSVNLSAHLVFSKLMSGVTVSAVDSGPIQIVANTIDSIVNPVTNLQSVTNLAEGIQGRDTETDAAFRVRRRNNLQVIAACTLNSIQARIEQDLDVVTKSFVFENRTDNIVNNLLPHSFKVVVAAEISSENSQLIGEKIWELKPAGIAMNGDVDVNVTDSNGDTQVVKFSYAKVKYVYVRLSYVKTGSDTVFPLDGEARIQNAILSLGQTLTFGSDILIQPFEATGYVAGGVTSAVVELALSDDPDLPEASVPWQTTNRSVDKTDLPSFDEQRIFISEA